MRSFFPNPRMAASNGLIAIGGVLSIETLLDAYAHGIFPWPQVGGSDSFSFDSLGGSVNSRKLSGKGPLLWFSPDPRGVLDFEDFHVPKSLKKWVKDHVSWHFTLNQAFYEVVRNCRCQLRPGQNGTWITEEMERAYHILFQEGYAVSLECWDGLELIGGIYGVDVGGVFSGESMFYRRPNASKVALWQMVEHLKGLGRKWMDVQMVTPVIQAMGGKYIRRSQFLDRLAKDLAD